MMRVEQRSPEATRLLLRKLHGSSLGAGFACGFLPLLETG